MFSRDDQDDRGRVLTVVSKKPTFDANEPPDYTTTYTYDTRDRLTTVAMPLGNKIGYTYEDGTNRLIDTIRVDATNKQQERVHLTLNVIGGKTVEDFQKCTSPAVSCAAWSSPSERTESFSYDSHNRLLRVTHPDATFIQYGYDSRGNLKTVQDERNAAANTTYTYDGLNRLSRSTRSSTRGS